MPNFQQSAAATRTLNFQTAFPNSNKGVKFSKDDVLEIIQQENCIAMRAYFALDSSGNPNGLQILLVGVDENGDDIIQSGAGQHNTSTAKLKGGTWICPPACGVANDLNHL